MAEKTMGERILEALWLGAATTASAYAGYAVSSATVGRNWAKSAESGAWWITPFIAPAVISNDPLVRAVFAGAGIGTFVAGVSPKRIKQKRKQQRRKKATA